MSKAVSDVRSHASVSGTVTAIDEKSSPSGARIKNIVISNDKKNELSPDIKPFPKRLTETTDDELISVIREAGVTGMGGASFPTYAKIASAAGKVEQMIINCAECEPFITANHRLLVEDPASVINGIKILLRAVGVRSAIIAVEDNKLDAVNILEEMLSRSRMISVAVMKTKYPQGDERQLVYALTGRELRQGAASRRRGLRDFQRGDLRGGLSAHSQRECRLSAVASPSAATALPSRRIFLYR